MLLNFVTRAVAIRTVTVGFSRAVSGSSCQCAVIHMHAPCPCFALLSFSCQLCSYTVVSYSRSHVQPMDWLRLASDMHTTCL
jgi:hypothetical protein